MHRFHKIISASTESGGSNAPDGVVQSQEITTLVLHNSFFYLSVSQSDSDRWVREDLFECLFVSRGGVDQKELWFALQKYLDVLFHRLAHQKLHKLILEFHCKHTKSHCCTC